MMFDYDDYNVYGDDNVMIMIFIMVKSMKIIMMMTMKNSNPITSFALADFQGLGIYTLCKNYT